jgi:hypothetical protein
VREALAAIKETGRSEPYTLVTTLVPGGAYGRSRRALRGSQGTPGSHWLKYVDWAASILKTPLRIVDGMAVVTEGPTTVFVGMKWPSQDIDWIETDAAGEPGDFALDSSGTFEKGGRRHAARRAHAHHCAARVAPGEFKQCLSDIADT